MKHTEKTALASWKHDMCEKIGPRVLEMRRKGFLPKPELGIEVIKGAFCTPGRAAVDITSSAADVADDSTPDIRHAKGLAYEIGLLFAHV
jgi:hypothetical protein